MRLLLFGIISLLSPPVLAAGPTADQVEFFETRIRPVLVEHCYSCHNSAKEAAGSLALDHRRGLRRGGDGGRIVVPGKPGQSRLL
ncbi:MAG: c-type cytochrome domain-containing protein, partial [Planctomycetota bacterium]|nr:c-type cytochrome domain-containing protein [Planctomycetota bacterium]